MLGGIRLRAALMSEIVDDPVCRYYLFSQVGIK
jgi:hypothetical protein